MLMHVLVVHPVLMALGVVGRPYYCCRRRRVLKNRWNVGMARDDTGVMTMDDGAGAGDDGANDGDGV